MSTETLVVTIVGLGAGWAAASLMKVGGYGVMGDLALGVGGSVLAAILARMLGIMIDAGWILMAVVALIGATTTIAAQRTFWTPRA